MRKIIKVGGLCSIPVIIGVMFNNFGDEFRTSQKGLEIIGDAEGCRRAPYVCPANVLTVGVGSTEASGKAINPQKRYSDLEIAERWLNDIKVAERCVNLYANGRSMPQSVFDATTSITFNVGCSAMQRSTMFRKAITADWQAVCNEFPRWVYASGKKLRGLEIRREKEKALCLTGLVSR